MENSIREDIKILETFLKGNKACKNCEIICADCYIDYAEVQAIKHIISECKILRDKFALISETCIDVSKCHIEEREGIKQIVEILGR